MNNTAKQRLRLQYLQRLGRYERGLKQRVTSVFRKQGRSLRNRYLFTGTVLHSDLDKYSRELRVLLMKYYNTVGNALGPSMVHGIKEETPFERELRIWSIARAATVVDGIEDTTWRAIQAVVLQSQSEGLGVVATANEIRKQTDILSTARAKTIARTELHIAANVAGGIVANGTGLQMKKTWVSAQDDRTRSSHRSANGQTVDISDPFIVNGYSLINPGDPNGPASEVINCRCTVIYTPT